MRTITMSHLRELDFKEIKEDGIIITAWDLGPMFFISRIPSGIRARLESAQRRLESEADFDHDAKRHELLPGLGVPNEKHP